MSPTPSESQLYFLGDRQYVQASAQLKYGLLEIEKDLEIENLTQIYVHRYKQLAETSTPLRLVQSDQIKLNDLVKSRLTISVTDRYFDYSMVSSPGTLDRTDKVFRQYRYTRIDKETASACLDNPLDFWESLEEAIQLAKVFHQQIYNLEDRYRFIVGGFEQLRFQEVDSSQTLTMTCRIHHHFVRRDTIYNQVKIAIDDFVHPYDFIMAFIGVKQGNEY